MLGRQKLRLASLIGVVACGAWADDTKILHGDKSQVQVTFEPGPDRGDRIYRIYCHHCHGEQDTGDGHVGKGLPVKPPDLTALDLSEAQVFKLVREGTAAQDGSIFMIAWKSVLRDEDIRDVAAYAVKLSRAKRK
jgi:mono/diheme cytochrome c family protein